MCLATSTIGGLGGPFGCQTGKSATAIHQIGLVLGFLRLFG